MADWRNRVSGASSRQTGLSVPLAKWNVDTNEIEFCFLKRYFRPEPFPFYCRRFFRRKVSTRMTNIENWNCFFLYIIYFGSRLIVFVVICVGHSTASRRLNHLSRFKSFWEDTNERTSNRSEILIQVSIIYTSVWGQKMTLTRWEIDGHLFYTFHKILKEIGRSIVFKISHLSRIAIFKSLLLCHPIEFRMKYRNLKSLKN